MLRTVAQRLAGAATVSQPVARVDGDDFALLMPSGADAAVALAAARRVVQAVSGVYDIEGRQIPVGCSIGVVLYPKHGGHETMLTHGAAATQAAKRVAAGTCLAFEPHMIGDTRERLQLVRDLREAISRGELLLHYQPKIHAPSGAITGAEALMRWVHPSRGFVSPGVFIPLAETYGLIDGLGNWLIEEACRQIREWRDKGLRMRVAVNLSVHQLRQPELAQHIGAALRRHRIDPRLLTCEITESLAMDDSAATMKMFEQLAALGVHVSIDDFGTGYSSLAYLRKLPAEELKIDRSFVLDLETSADARAVVDAVVRLAHALGLKVVAEGVENERQDKILRALDCDELQGFLFAKPMPAKALELWAMTNDGPAPLAFRDSLFKDTMTEPSELTLRAIAGTRGNDQAAGSAEVAGGLASSSRIWRDGPPRMEARPTGSGRERSSPNR